MGLRPPALRRREEHPAIAHFHRDFAQGLAAARPGHAFAALQLETGAVHGAHQQAVLAAQEPARRPIEPAPRVRAHVQPCAHPAFGIAMHDQRFRIAIQHRFDFVQAIDGQRIQPQQWRGGSVGI